MIATSAIMSWVLANPNRDGRSWAGWDGSMLYRMGLAPHFPSIRQMIDAAGQINPDQDQAPIGAIHFWRTVSHAFDHAGVDLHGGGKVVVTTGEGTWQETIGDGLLIKQTADISDHLAYLGWITHDHWP